MITVTDTLKEWVADRINQLKLCATETFSNLAKIENNTDKIDVLLSLFLTLNENITLTRIMIKIENLQKIEKLTKFEEKPNA